MEENKKTFNWTIVGGITGLVFGIVAVIFAFINNGNGVPIDEAVIKGLETAINCIQKLDNEKECTEEIIIRDMKITISVNRIPVEVEIEKPGIESPDIDKDNKDESKEGVENKEDLKQSEDKFQPDKIELPQTISTKEIKEEIKERRCKGVKK